MLISVFTLFLFWQLSELFHPNLVSLGIILLAIYFVWLIYKVFRRSKEKKKRIADLQTFATANGWTPLPSADGSNFPNWQSYSILDHGGEKIRPFLQREYDGGHVCLFDYTYRERRGKVVRYYTQTIVAFQSPHLNLPFFMMAQETVGSRLGELFGYRDIDFDSHPRFSEKYHLAGNDEMQIRTVFIPPVLGYLETLPNLQLDGGGNSIFIYNHATVIPIEQLNKYLEMGVEVYKLFRR